MGCKKPFASFIVLLLLCAPLLAQVTQLRENPIRFYNKGLELFDKEKYGAAQKQFSLYLDQCSDPLLRINTEYYIASCALELMNTDAVMLFNRIMERYPESPKAKAAAFQLGRYYFRQKEYTHAMKQMEHVDTDYLTPDELSEYYFIIGYCQFRKENYTAAKTAFGQTTEIKNKYYFPANYYYGYICYQEQEHDAALKHFERTVSSKIYGPIVPLYISQVYYAKGMYSTVISYADTITNKEIVSDVALVLGKAYYESAAFDKAQPAFEKYKASGKPMAGEDIYRAAYTFYQNKDYEKAYLEFQRVAEGKDTLAQYANFNLGDCYLRLNKKQSARLAFERSYNIGHIKTVKGEALFNLARLSYELAYHQLAARQLVEFINGYPESDNNEEAKKVLSELFLNTKNYQEAIPILESIRVKNNEIKTAYQRVTYYRGEELYLNNEFAGARELFTKSANFNFDKKLYSLSHFWLGEMLYRDGKYEEAESKFNICLSYYTNEIKDTKYYPLSYYNIGYCEFKLERFSNALTNFEKLRSIESFYGSQPEMYLDGCMRIADCYFKQKNYDKAMDAYDYAIGKNAVASDYALYQKGTILGIFSRFDEKVKTLRQIPARFPRSGYVDDALYEIADTRLEEKDYPSAIREFEYILSEYPNSMYTRRVKMNLGQIYYNLKEDEKALDQFKKVAELYPKSEEAKEAKVSVETIYINMGESSKYLDWLKTLGASVSLSYTDSLSYNSGLAVYKNGNCIKATQIFTNYLKSFPDGFFRQPASFYLAECAYKDKAFDTALVNYQYVLSQPRSEFSERAARMAATILYLKKDFVQSLSYYYLLEDYAQDKDNMMVAYLGELRCSYKTNRLDTAFIASKKLAGFSASTKEALIEAHLIMGRIFIDKLQQPDSAKAEFEYVLKETKNVNAAEAKYNLAYISFLKGDLKSAETQVFELNDNFSSFDYWVAKGFILLAEIYTAKNDLFQAKATLKSVIDNYKGEDLRSIAREKLGLLETREKSEKELKDQKNKQDGEE